jgi:glucokinase
VAGDPVVTYGADVGGTNVRVAAVDGDGAVLAEQRAPTPPGWQAVVATISELCGQVAGATAPVAVGVGTAGLVDRDGVVHYAPNLPDFIHVPLGAALRDALGVPVVVDNDANAAAWGEVCHGAARGLRDVLVITLGTGVGGGIVANGEIYRGAHGFAAEVGHFQTDPHGLPCACGQVGHWEASASGNALGQMGRERAATSALPSALERVGGDVSKVTGITVGGAAQAGARDAVAVVAAYAEQVAVGIAGLANILDPARIVVSGGLVELGEVLFAPLRASVRGRLEGAAFRPEIEVVAAELGERAGVIGAAALARRLIPNAVGGG